MDFETQLFDQTNIPHVSFFTVHKICAALCEKSVFAIACILPNARFLSYSTVEKLFQKSLPTAWGGGG